MPTSVTSVFDTVGGPLAFFNQQVRQHEQLIQQLIVTVSPTGGKKPSHVALSVGAIQSTSVPDLEQRALRRHAKQAAEFFKDILESINHDIQKKRAGAAPLTIEDVLQQSETWKRVLERAEEVEIHKKLSENAITLAKIRGSAFTETVVVVLARFIPRLRAASMFDVSLSSLDECKRRYLERSTSRCNFVRQQHAVAALPRSQAGQPAAGDRSSRRRRRRRLSTSDEDEEDENSSSEEAEEDTRERASGHNRQRQRTSGGDSNNAQSENAHVDYQAHGQAGCHETGASEVGSIDPAADLPAVDTFIVFEWIDYENQNNLKKRKAKKVKNFSLGKVTHVEVDDDDPALESTINVNIWGHPPGSSQYTGEYLPAWLCGDAEKQSMYNPSTEAEEYKPWEKLVLACNIISLDVSMKSSGQGDESSLLIQENDQKQIK
eukprot:g30018.t1